MNSFKNYQGGEDIHYASGIFNKAFYHLATTNGWDPKSAFEVFLQANMGYWTPRVTMQQAALGVMLAAVDLGRLGEDVVNAFKMVDIEFKIPQKSGAVAKRSLKSDDQIVEPEIQCGRDLAIFELREAMFSEGWVYFELEVGHNDSLLMIHLAGEHDLDLYLRWNHKPLLELYDYAPLLQGSWESIEAPSIAGIWYVGVRISDRFEWATINVSGAWRVRVDI